MRSLLWAFPPHPVIIWEKPLAATMYTNFNDYLNHSVTEMTDRSTRVHESNEANWGSVSEEGRVLCC